MSKKSNLKNLTKKLNLGYINSNITDQNFPFQEMPKGEIKVFHFNQSLTTKEIEERLEKEGYRPATIYEMLTHAKDNWDGKEWWVALGSVWVGSDGGRGVACLDRYGSERYLYLYWGNPDNRWREDYRFVAVSKSPLESETLGSTSSLEARVTKLESKFEAMVNALK